VSGIHTLPGSVRVKYFIRPNKDKNILILSDVYWQSKLIREEICLANCKPPINGESLGRFFVLRLVIINYLFLEKM
jgi:hypothetical protein